MREVLATEALQTLGVNTSRTLSIVETGEALDRHDEPSPTRAAVLVRLSHSHMRIGTFQRLCYFEQHQQLEKLVQYNLRYLFPQVSATSFPEQIKEFYGEVVQGTARMTAQWMMAGFVHGVLNTDNINVTGESFDYGPYRFLPYYDPQFVAAYFDHTGLYAYSRQAWNVHWALEQLAQSLTPLIPYESLHPIREGFVDAFQVAVQRQFMWRLGLHAADRESENDLLLAEFFTLLEDQEIPFEQAFFDFYAAATRKKFRDSPYRARYEATTAGQKLTEHISQFSVREDLRLEDPYWQRDYALDMRIEEIEKTWAPIAARDDWAFFNEKIAEIRRVRVAQAHPLAPSHSSRQPLVHP
jgi:uncharacterized protein YdiU (UPF0061 family)